MIEEDEAGALYVQLLAALRSTSELGPIAAAVEDVVRLGRDEESSELLSTEPGRRRVRETVRRSRPLTGNERLLVLVDAMERAIVTPVVVARSILDALVELEPGELELVLRVDRELAEDVQSGGPPAGGPDDVVITEADVVAAEARTQLLAELLRQLKGKVQES